MNCWKTTFNQYLVNIIQNGLMHFAWFTCCNCMLDPYPVSDFWHSSSCSRRWGSNCPMNSSPTQHWTTLVFSWARTMIFTQDLSMLEKRLASCTRKQGRNKQMKIRLAWKRLWYKICLLTYRSPYWRSPWLHLLSHSFFLLSLVLVCDHLNKAPKLVEPN